jgi:hypothetical protein
VAGGARGSRHAVFQTPVQRWCRPERRGRNLDWGEAGRVPSLSCHQPESLQIRIRSRTSAACSAPPHLCGAQERPHVVVCPVQHRVYAHEGRPALAAGAEVFLPLCIGVAPGGFRRVSGQSVGPQGGGPGFACTNLSQEKPHVHVVTGVDVHTHTYTYTYICTHIHANQAPACAQHNRQHPSAVQVSLEPGVEVRVGQEAAAQAVRGVSVPHKLAHLKGAQQKPARVGARGVKGHWLNSGWWV